jgi:hypothetical protein
MSVFKLEVTHPNVQARAVQFADDDHGRVPDNLAELTMTIIALHKANGDTGWLVDMVHDADDEKPGHRAITMAEEMAANYMDNPTVVQLLTEHDLLP